MMKNPENIGIIIKLKLISIIVVFMGSMFLFSIPHARTVTVNPERYSIDSKPFGTPYRDWIAKFWQWMISIPQPSNPNYGSYTDINIKCSINQTDPHVWFLVPTFGGPAERTCYHSQRKGHFVSSHLRRMQFFGKP